MLYKIVIAFDVYLVSDSISQKKDAVTQWPKRVST